MASGDQRVPASAAAVARRMLGGVDVLLERLGAAYRTVPEYAALPPGVMEDEVLPISRQIVEGFLRAASAGEMPPVDEFPAAARSGRRRLEMGVPLEPMLHVYRIAGAAPVRAARPAGRRPALSRRGARCRP